MVESRTGGELHPGHELGGCADLAEDRIDLLAVIVDDEDRIVAAVARSSYPATYSRPPLGAILATRLSP
jgi:hypothetical protein